MIKFPVRYKKIVIGLQTEIDVNCEVKSNHFCLPCWTFSERAIDGLRLLLQLPCVDSGHSVSSIAESLSSGDFCFIS